MTEKDLKATLQAVFQLSRANRHVDASSIGRAVGISPTRSASALLELERLELVDASRARLTMKGLVAAVSSGRGLAGVRLDIKADRPRGSCSAPPTVSEDDGSEDEPGDEPDGEIDGRGGIRPYLS